MKVALSPSCSSRRKSCCRRCPYLAPRNCHHRRTSYAGPPRLGQSSRCAAAGCRRDRQQNQRCKIERRKNVPGSRNPSHADRARKPAPDRSSRHQLRASSRRQRSPGAGGGAAWEVVLPQRNPRRPAADRASLSSSRPGIQPRNPGAAAARGARQFASPRYNQRPTSPRELQEVVGFVGRGIIKRQSSRESPPSVSPWWRHRCRSRSPPRTMGPPMSSNSSCRPAARSFCMELRIAGGALSKPARIRAASISAPPAFATAQVSAIAECQFRFPIRVRQNLAKIHSRCRRGQRKWRQEAELPPQQSLLVRNELAGESKLAQLSNDGSQKRLSAGGEVEENERGALDESSRSNPLRFHRDRGWNHALAPKSRPEHRDVVHSVQQGNDRNPATPAQLRAQLAIDKSWLQSKARQPARSAWRRLRRSRE